MTPAQLDEKRTAILTTAVRVFGARGYHATNIADIAQELGAGHGTFYRYYKNKLDIFAHVVDHVVARVGAALLDEKPDATRDLAAYRRQVERIGTRLASLFFEEEHVARLLFVEAVGIDADITRKLDAAYDAFAAMTAAYLVNGQARKFVRRDLDVAIAARAINAMIFESVRRAAASPDPRAAAREWTRAVVALMFDGIARA